MNIQKAPSIIEERNLVQKKNPLLRCRFIIAELQRLHRPRSLVAFSLVLNLREKRKIIAGIAALAIMELTVTSAMKVAQAVQITGDVEIAKWRKVGRK